ncbi:MAG: L-arabinose isomerase family protein [Rectinemataceae bacterium]
MPNQVATIGLLPFYLKLYDDLDRGSRAGFDAYIRRIEGGFASRGLKVVTAEICRVAGEFAGAVQNFEKAGVDAVVTLHLAYSPSLEAIEAFAGTKLPIVILDSTMDADFGTSVKADRIMYNHGIHGVMDFASLLRRRGRSFEIVAGHDSDPRVLDRAADLVRAARAAGDLRGSRVLRVGETFAGMGDFSVPESVMVAKLGVQTKQISLDELDKVILQVSEAAVAEEVAADRLRFACELPEEVHLRSVRVGLGLRRLLEEGGYGGFSVNFLAFDRRDRPSDTMPFLEISKAMARGIGYGGEGDVLTASMVGALARAFGQTTFTEIFCPDWAGDSLFLSHMGEISPSVAGDKPRMISKPFFGGGARDPALLTCAVQPGKAVFVNLVPGPQDSFSLIVAPVEVLAEDSRLDPPMRDTVRAWVRPPGGVARFLEAYSRLGGTHHSALVLGDRAEAIAAFGRWSGWTVTIVDGSGR